MIDNQYDGFHPAADWKPPTAKVDSKFFNDFVKTRTPCVIDYPIKLSLDQLRSRCAEVPVMVEQSVNNSFGHGIKHQMKFAEFLENISLYYLNTQYEIDEGLTEFLAPPLHAVRDIVPELWNIVPELVPHQMNVWIGSTSAKDGTSSGLHHDFRILCLTFRRQLLLFDKREEEVYDF
jgi:hypothetical protein